MKCISTKKVLSLALTVVMVVSLFAVCGFGSVSAAVTRELPIKTWNAKELVSNANSVGTQNIHECPIFTTYDQTIGRRSLIDTGYFIHNAKVEHTVDGKMQFRDGTTVTLLVRLFADAGYSEGELCIIDVGYALETHPDEYNYQFYVDYKAYDALPTQVDPIFGYEYKLFTYTFDLIGEIFDDPNENTLEVRATSRNADYATTVFSIEMIDMDDNVLAKYDGEAMASLPGMNGSYELVTNDPLNPAGIVSYSGHDDPALSWRDFDPYAFHSADGQKDLGFPGALLIDGLGQTINDAGTYSFSFEQSTMFSLGVKKVTYVVKDKTANQEVARLHVDKSMVDATVGSDSGAFEIRSVPFTVTNATAGHEFVCQVLVFNQTDYRLRAIRLNMVIDENTPIPDDVQAVIDAITNLDIADGQAVANARAAFDALSEIGQSWVGSELEEKLVTYETARVEGDALVKAIDDLGDPNELNLVNYTQKTQALVNAEALRGAFVETYDQEIVVKLISNLSALTDFRAAYDAIELTSKDEHRQPAIDAVIAAITAIGSADDITAENLSDKIVQVTEAKELLDNLVEIYGDNVLAEVTNYNDFVNAQEKINALSYMLGDPNKDTAIGAADALLVLKYVVGKETLTDAAFTAADVSGNQKVEAGDALLILQYVVGKITSFPAEKN